MFVQAIDSASERIWIASPYFVPDPPVVTALQLAGLRGVDVRILPLLWLPFASIGVSPAEAQQFKSDHQWVAPHGVGTFVISVGQEYSTVMAVAADTNEFAGWSHIPFPSAFFPSGTGMGAGYVLALKASKRWTRWRRCGTSDDRKEGRQPRDPGLPRLPARDGVWIRFAQLFFAPWLIQFLRLLRSILSSAAPPRGIRPPTVCRPSTLITK